MPTVEQAFSEIPTVITCSKNESRTFVPVELTVGSGEKVGTHALVDSGAEGLFMDQEFVNRHQIPTIPLRNWIKVRNVDGTENQQGVIMEQATVKVAIGTQEYCETFLVTTLGGHDIILGHPWLEKQNPVIDWKQRTIELDSMEHAHKATALAQAHSGRTDSRTLRERLPEALHKYTSVFDEEDAKRFPPSRSYDHRIELKEGFVPKVAKVYPLSRQEEQMLDEFIDDNLAKGYIVPSTSDQASAVFFVAKKDGKGRLCQDYRHLNDWTVKNAYPLPRIGEIMDKASKWKRFSVMDIKAGYNNIRLASEADQRRAAFVTKRGLFQPTVMFFGLCNSPATFQAFMDDIYGSMIRENRASIYMDDILTGGADEEGEECMANTEEAVRIAHNNDLHIGIKKSLFCQKQVPYLGMLISHGKIEMDPVKLAGIADWPIPKCVKDVRSFLGFSNFYRKFISGYADVSRPLTDLTRKNQKWEWTEECQGAFDRLKEAFLGKPVLQIPDKEKPFILETDASKYASGAVLMQEDINGDLKPCGFISHRFNQAEQNYQIYDRELLAIIRGLKAWKHYLMGAPITIRCDHKNLTFFRNPQFLTPRQARWQIFLSLFDYKLAHVPGQKLIQADALSRRPDADRRPAREGRAAQRVGQDIKIRFLFQGRAAATTNIRARNPATSASTAVTTADAGYDDATTTADSLAIKWSRFVKRRCRGLPTHTADAWGSQNQQPTTTASTTRRRIFG